MADRWYAYMVECDDLSLYAGATNDLLARVRAHNSGRGAKYTRARRPVHLVWSMACDTKSEALRLEARVKAMTRMGKEALLPWGPRGPDNVLLKAFLSESPPAPSGLGPAESFAFSSNSMRGFRGGFKAAYLDGLARRYAWAVPTEPALEVLAALGPLVEAGAGLGYWASLLRARGCDVLAFDERPPPDPLNLWCAPVRPFTEVLRGGPEALGAHRSRSLFLCWPPSGSQMASESFAAWGGEKAAIAGPRDLVADEAFHAWIRSEFLQIAEVPLPGRPGAPDSLTTWRRR